MFLSSFYLLFKMEQRYPDDNPEVIVVNVLDNNNFSINAAAR